MSSDETSVQDVDRVADKLQITQLDVESHWNGFWEAAFIGDKEYANL